MNEIKSQSSKEILNKIEKEKTNPDLKSAVVVSKESYEKLCKKYPSSQKYLDNFIMRKCKFYSKMNQEGLEKYGFGNGRKLEWSDKLKDSIELVQFDYEKPKKKEVDIDGEKKLEVLTYKYLMDYEPQEQEWLIKNVIPKGEVGLLVGKRGERKTFTAYYLALCLAGMKQAFGMENVTEKKKVLIVDEETGINELAKRMQFLKRGLGIIDNNLEIKFTSFEGIKIDEEAEDFKKLIYEFKPDLILIDCLQRVVNFEVDRDNASISRLFTEVVRPTIKAFGVTWLFIHHLRKSPPQKYNPDDLLDEVRGGSELTNYCRYVLLTQLPKNYENKENTEFMIFRVLKMSNAPIPEPFVISFETTENEIKVNYEGIPSEILSAEVRCASKIKEYLFSKQITDFRTKDMKDASEEIGSKGTFIGLGLNILLKEGFLTKPKQGYWKVSGDFSQTKISEGEGL